MYLHKKREKDTKDERIFLATSYTSTSKYDIQIISVTWVILQVMSERSSETTTTALKPQKIERLRTFKKEHRDALDRAASLNIPHAVSSTEEEAAIHKKSGTSSGDEATEISQNVTEGSQKTTSASAGGRVNWNEVVGMLFDRDESGNLLLKQDTVSRI